jgi:hypothetical protein
MGVVHVHPTEGSSPDEPDPDDADTGPLRVSESAQSADTWASRFDTPLTVNPRQLQDNRRPIVFFSVVAVVVVAVVGGLIFWLVRPSSDTPDSPNANQVPPSASASGEADTDAQALMRLLPAGYPAGSCKPVAARKGMLAQVNCETNSDQGGPMTATYSLVKDRATLDAAFNAVVAGSTRVNCPGNIQSPGPWRRNATPDKTSGTLFCGLRDDRPTVAWTDEPRLVVSVVQAGPKAPTFDELYAWWSSHS